MVSTLNADCLREWHVRPIHTQTHLDHRPHTTDQPTMINSTILVVDGNWKEALFSKTPERCVAGLWESQIEDMERGW